MGAPPSVVAIVLNWNGKEVLGDCLSSLLVSDYPKLEVLVVDNGSVDGSVAYLRSNFPTVRLALSPINLGFAGGNNLGIRQALEQGADYILLLNNDTVVDPECVSRLVRVAEGNPQYGALNPKIYYYDPPDHLWYAGGAFSLWKGVSEHWGYKAVDKGEYETLQEVTFVTGCALLVRATVLREVGLLDERLFNYAEDADLSIRILKAGYRLVYVPQARLWHREGFSALKHHGRGYRSYQYIRNSLWVLTKHARPMQLLIAFPYFVISGVLRLTLIALLQGDSQAACAPIHGLASFMRMLITSRGQDT